MKKTLLAAALAVGFAGAAHAQTSVTLFGVIDGGIGYTQNKRTALNGVTTKFTRTGLSDGYQNGSRWGLRGTEDLGGGLKAIFHVEGGFNQNQGVGGQAVTNEGTDYRLFGRQAYLGLQSDAWGALTVGRQYGLAADLATVVSPHGDIYGINSVHQTFGVGFGANRVDNMVKYETPDFSGFTLKLGYSFQASGAQASKQKGLPDTNSTYAAIGLRYTDGPLTLGINYDQVGKRDNVPGERDIKSWMLAGSYNFDVATLHLGYSQDKDGVMIPFGRSNQGGAAGDGNLVNGTGAGNNYIRNFKANNYSLGFTIPVDAGSKFMVNWSSARLGNGVRKTNNRAAGGKNSYNIYTLGYRYDLSKRTNMYAVAGLANGINFFDSKSTQLVVGLRHGF